MSPRIRVDRRLSVQKVESRRLLSGVASWLDLPLPPDQAALHEASSVDRPAVTAPAQIGAVLADALREPARAGSAGWTPIDGATALTTIDSLPRNVGPAVFGGGTLDPAAIDFRLESNAVALVGLPTAALPNFEATDFVPEFSLRTEGFSAVADALGSRPTGLTAVYETSIAGFQASLARDREATSTDSVEAGGEVLGRHEAVDASAYAEAPWALSDADFANDAYTESFVMDVVAPEADRVIGTGVESADDTFGLLTLPAEEPDGQVHASFGGNEADPPRVVGPASEGLASAPRLDRVGVVAAPPAGAETPGAGVIDLSALLLVESRGAAVDVNFPAEPTEHRARDAAFAVESWVRSIPARSVPASRDAIDGAGGQARSAIGGVVPIAASVAFPERTPDRIAGSPEAEPESAPGGESSVVPVAPFGRARVAAILASSLLGGAVLGVTRRWRSIAGPECVEHPLREPHRRGHE